MSKFLGHLHHLIPYGFDVVEDLITAAKELMPEYADNFTVLSIHDLDKIAATGLPATYDFVHFPVWDDWNFDKTHHWEVLETVWSITNDCLMVSFYDPNREAVNAKLQKLLTQFRKPDGEALSPRGSEAMVWYNKS